MLHAPAHQVAGHTGDTGPLIDGAGLFFKPLQSDSRGDTELAFYTFFSSHPLIPSTIRRFFPAFHGTRVLPPDNLPHIVLDDLLSPLQHPSLIDFKIGSRTWPINSTQQYITKCQEKDRHSTSLSLGFRVSGLQIQYHGIDKVYKPDRKIVKKYNVEDVRRVLKRFVSVDPDVGDCHLARRVYGGMLAELNELKVWFEEQTIFHIYSASVLLAYEEREDGGMEVRVRVVDFAHWVEGEGVIDHNFLGGLCSLIKFVKEVLREADEEGNAEVNGA